MERNGEISLIYVILRKITSAVKFGKKFPGKIPEIFSPLHELRESRIPEIYFPLHELPEIFWARTKFPGTLKIDPGIFFPDFNSTKKHLNYF